MKTEPNSGAYPLINNMAVEGGLTKLEYFTGLAMQGIMASGSHDFTTVHQYHIAEIALRQAYATIEALNNIELQPL